MSLDGLPSKITVVQACEVFAVSRQAYYAARRRREAPRVVRPPQPATRRPHVTVEALRPAIERIVREHPAWGVRKVWAMLRREDLRVSQRRVWALMRTWGLTLKPDRVVGKDPPRGKVVVPDANRRWATDLTTVWTKQDGLVAVVPVIDCGCRSLLALEATKHQDSAAVLAPVRSALADTFGSPETVPPGLELRTDHGSQYTGADCEAFCAQWRLEHTLAPVGRPTGNSVAERVIRTLKEEVIWLRDWQSLAEVQAALAAWTTLYNHVRPHQALKYATPAERRAKLLSPKKAAA